MIEAIIKPSLSQEEAMLEFSTYLQERTQGRLSDDDAWMLAKTLRCSMLPTQPEDRESTVELLQGPWFQA